MTNETKKNVYVQPDCQVFQVQLQQVIATSGAATTSTSNEEYETGSIEGWF